MSVDPIGGGFLAEKWDLIREIGRNIAATPIAVERSAGKPASLTLPDPLSQGIPPPPADRSSLPTDSPERLRAAALSSMMEALRAPLAGPAQRVGQEWAATLAQSLADFVTAGTGGVKPTLAQPLADFVTAGAGGAKPTLGVATVDSPASGFEGSVAEFFGPGNEQRPGARQPVGMDVSLVLRPEPQRSEVNWERPSFAEARAETPRISAGEKATLANAAPIMTLPGEVADASVQAEMIRRGLVELDLTSMAAGVITAAPERAGVIASFVLNAHFLPGWPPARPFANPEAKAFVEVVALDKTLSRSEVEMLTYLANFGVSLQHLEKLIKALKRAGDGPGLAQALACLLGNLSAAVRALSAELESFIADISVEGQLQTKPAPGNRRRIDLS
ncbi:hypothetical protein [Mesorhizobium sp. ANAO-SY3R2]|uniref:hypothetical protein n=1 Tax=Mesorhizobium sp. ANAO-SY3R2 TaxID=3166644 RepID=UPI00366BC9A0